MSAATVQKNVGSFVDACTRGALKRGILEGPGAPRTNPRLPSLKPSFAITEQELCKDIPLQQKISRNYFTITDAELQVFRINFDYRS